MKSKPTFVVAALLAFTFASGARADWQYTKWGMTPEQFAKASSGSAFVIPFNSQRARSGKACIVDGTYTSGQQQFRLTGCFEGQSLNLVVLEFPGKATRRDVGELISALTARYGRPTAIEPNYMWTDMKGGNQLELYDVDLIQHLEVLYRPIKMGGGL